jgi:hypothetical protein
MQNLKKNPNPNFFNWKFETKQVIPKE